MQNLVKVASGVKNIDGIKKGFGRQDGQGRIIHATRNMPKQAAEIIDGGSLYWIVGRAFCARQRVIDILAAKDMNGVKFAALILDPEVIAVEPMPHGYQQGWRYLAPEAAPKDVGSTGASSGLEDMPQSMIRELRGLCLI